MTYSLGDNRYGKSRIRLVTVRRGPDRHHLRDLTVDVALEGDFEAAHTGGDNANVIATDTMKNTVYALARDRFTGPAETFGLELGRHFAAQPVVTRATIGLREHGWSRVELDGGPAPDAFVRSAGLVRTSTVSVDGEPGGSNVGPVTVQAGFDDLTVMKTTKSAFSGFARDRYTTLPEADDRLMATRISASWGYRSAVLDGGGFDFDAAWERAHTALLRSLGEHFSPSVQASIWIMAGAMMDAEGSIDWVRMVLPNLHHWTVDLSSFGLDNPGEVFVATTEPHGLIDATVHRRS
jgi:urate oxidase